MKLKAGWWEVNKSGDEYAFSVDPDYSVVRAQRNRCELVGKQFDEAKKIFEVEIENFFK